MRLRLALFFAIAFPSPVGAMTGNELLQFCREERGSFGRIYCAGYIEGLIDGIAQMRVEYDTQCLFPEGVTNGQFQEIVVIWLEQYPERRHEDALSLAARAVMQAFPCKKRGN